MITRALLVSLGILALLLSIGISAVVAIVGMERVSVASDGAQGNDVSFISSISADGRHIAFASAASNLVQGDANGAPDVFVRDRQSNATTLVSLASDGTQGNDVSEWTSISADGRYVAFSSYASNLVPGDTNGDWDMFVRDLQTNTTTRVSIASDGTQGNANSSNSPSISADGRYVAFPSNASNLVAGDTNGRSDIFVRDRQTGTTTRISIASDGTQGNGNSAFPSISADGRYVAFVSYASNLVPGDTNGVWDIFVRDRQANTTTRVSVASDGTQGNDSSYTSPSISADGRYVAFLSFASNLVPGDTNATIDVFVRDRQTDTTTRVSLANDGMQGNSASEWPSISADGRYVAFASAASNLVPADTNGVSDVFVRDRQTDTTTRVSLATDGTQGNGDAIYTSISADGQHVAFESTASNLVPGDTNDVEDVFVATLAQPNTTLASVNTSLGQVNFSTDAGSISGLANIPPESMPCSAGGFIFPYGMFSYSITNLAPGATAIVTIRTPISVPMGSKFFKCQNGNLTDFSANSTQLDPNTFILTLKDGGQGDADGVANGTIVDPCGPAFMDTSNNHRSSAQVPTVQGPAPIANIAVQSASLSIARVAPGAPVTITANVANKGTANGSSQIKLYVNGQEEAHQGITLSSGTSTPVKFTVSRDEPGTYSVYVGSIPAGTFTVDTFADPNIILYISGALILFALAGGVIFMATRRRQR
jgi:Tol biopolymer transport system component